MTIADLEPLMQQAPDQQMMVTEDQKQELACILSRPLYTCLSCGVTMSDKAERLRHGYFTEIGASVGEDEMGWPSVEPYMVHYEGYPRTGGKAATMSEIEYFQRTAIFFNLVLCEASEHIFKTGCSTALDLFCVNFAGCCGGAPSSADAELLRSSLDDHFFNEIFNAHFGGTMLRAPLPSEAVWGDAVVCDLRESLQGFELREGHVYHPCRVVFRQGKQGLVVEAIVTGGAGSPETAYRPDTGTPEEWLWAKRQAVAGALQRHQYQEHLVYGHMVMETFVALAYKYLSPEHYAFKLLGPVSGDVGFVNRSWGMDMLVNGTGEPINAWCIGKVTPRALLSEAGVLSQILHAQRSFEARKSWFWFDEGGYVMGGCGVQESIPFVVRDTARRFFDVTLAWTSSVVEAFWQEEDHALRSWWEAIWWKQMQPARRDLSRASLARLLATCIVQATYIHDLAHEVWLPENYAGLQLNLVHRGGRSTDPADYLPTHEAQRRLRLSLMALNGSSLESPLLCYRKVFKEDRLQEALRAFEDGLVRIVQATPSVTHVGSMSH